MRYLTPIALVALTVQPLLAAQYHVSPGGSDQNSGSASSMFMTISAAARVAQAGDAIVIHEGTYRERINPPRGGESDRKRITYEAAGGKVIIKGSEVVTGWQKLQNDTWKATLPNSFFGSFNPYSDVIRGDWFDARGREHHTGAVYLNGHWLAEAAGLDPVLEPVGDTPLWFAQVDASDTTIWAQFRGVNPNEAEVEINVRQSVFYPEKPGINYITVRGLTMMHAATPWAPPTARQIGLIGTHWSRGWIIENNDIRYSTCVGVTLGKYGDEFDNTSANTAEGYVKTIERALASGWSKENIGHHIVRNNRIAHCEQGGIVGSLGPVFSTVTGNIIHDIHVRGLFGGAEMAGIKFHAAIDTQISRNHIYRTCRGIWLDWMAQGTRVTGNLLHDNGPGEDLFVEVNHGPFLIDNNLFLSPITLLDMSQGGAFVHNLFSGRIVVRPELGRETPFHQAHTTQVAGLHRIPGGDHRFYNNIFAGHNGLSAYDNAAQPVFMAGNVFLKSAAASRHERAPLALTDVDPNIGLTREKDGVIRLTIDGGWLKKQPHPLVTTEMLGRAKIPNLPFEQPDGSPYRLDADYLGKSRNPANPAPGPFELTGDSPQVLTVWPIPARP